MGFPVGYSELPKLLLHLLFLLAHLRKLTNWACRCLGLGGGLSDGDVQREGLCLLPPVLADVIEEASPATRFEQLPEAAESCCAVCLCEFELEDEVRRMSNCRHVFHRQCVDRWLQHRQRTCPLCRFPLVPFNPPPATPEDDEDYYYYSLDRRFAWRQIKRWFWIGDWIHGADRRLKSAVTLRMQISPGGFCDRNCGVRLIPNPNVVDLNLLLLLLLLLLQLLLLQFLLQLLLPCCCC